LSCGISLDEFWGRADDITTGMTLAELDLAVEAYRHRIEMQHELLAWHAANIMNMWTKRGRSITADKLMGRENTQLSPQELQRQLDEESSRARAAAQRKQGGADERQTIEEMLAESAAWVARVLSSVEDDDVDELDDDDQEA
jgi:hypothetical protein